MGNLDISASYHSNDELAVLYKQFNLMMQRIQTLIDHVYEEQSAKQEMEIRLLQSQINPPFSIQYFKHHQVLDRTGNE